MIWVTLKKDSDTKKCNPPGIFNFDLVIDWDKINLIQQNNLIFRKSEFIAKASVKAMGLEVVEGRKEKCIFKRTLYESWRNKVKAAAHYLGQVLCITYKGAQKFVVLVYVHQLQKKYQATLLY